MGTPEMRPVAAWIASPWGRPEAANAVGALLADTWNVNACPTTAFALRALVIDGGAEGVEEGGDTTTDSIACPVPEALLADSATVNVPAAAGVPEIEPVAGSMRSPNGRPVAAYEVGALLATTWNTNACPTVAVAELGLVMAGGAPGAGCAAIETESVALPVPAALLAASVTGKAPAAAGTPEMTPVPASMDSPGGSGAAEYDVGEFVAVIW